MIRKFIGDVKHYQKSVSRSSGDRFGMFAREIVPVPILSMICEAHFPSVREDGLADEQAYRGLTEEYDLGC